MIAVAYVKSSPDHPERVLNEEHPIEIDIGFRIRDNGLVLPPLPDERMSREVTPISLKNRAKTMGLDILSAFKKGAPEAKFQSARLSEWTRDQEAVTYQLLIKASRLSLQDVMGVCTPRGDGVGRGSFLTKEFDPWTHTQVFSKEPGVFWSCLSSSEPAMFEEIKWIKANHKCDQSPDAVERFRP